jgi:hypothetical protein
MYGTGDECPKVCGWCYAVIFWCFVGYPLMFGAGLLLVTPLQLSSAVDGLACPSSSWWQPWSWLC